MDAPPPAVLPDKLDAVMSSEPLRVSRTMLAVDASPDRASCSISVAGVAGGRLWGGLMWHGPLHRDQVVAAIGQLCEQVDPEEIVVDPRSPAQVIVQPLIDSGVDAESIHLMTWAEVKASTSAFLAGVDEQTIVVDESQVLRDGFASATLREDKDGGVAWDRQSGTICQVVALSHALWAVSRREEVTVDRRPVAALRPVRRRSSTPKQF